MRSSGSGSATCRKPRTSFPSSRCTRTSRSGACCTATIGRGSPPCWREPPRRARDCAGGSALVRGLRGAAGRDGPGPRARSPLGRRFGRRGGCGLLVSAALARRPWATTESHTHELATSLYYVVLAIGWNLLAGYTGQFSLAHHTFAGIGAYTSALLVQRAGIPILAGVVAGAVAAAAVGYGLATLCLPLPPIYPALPPSA